MHKILSEGVWNSLMCSDFHHQINMTCDKVAINGPSLKKLAQKKIKLAKVVVKEKKILARTWFLIIT